MDKKDFELFATESKTNSVELKKSVDALRDLLNNKLPQQINTPDNIQVKGSVEITNPTTDIEITNIDLIKEWLEELGIAVSTAVHNSKTEPVTSVTVKNIGAAKSDNVKISNMQELATILAPAFKALRDVPPPVVNLETPPIVFPTDPKKPIAVRLSDGKSFYNAIVQAIATGNGVEDPLAGYQITDSDETTATKYYGYTRSNGYWYIMRENAGAYRYTKGASNYTAYWTDRATNDYSYYYEVF